MNNFCHSRKLTVTGAVPESIAKDTGQEINPKQGELLRSLSRMISWVLKKVRSQQARRLLKVCESVSLGDKRFVALIQVEHERFLIGGSSGSVSMLARLQAESFTEVLRNSREMQ